MPVPLKRWREVKIEQKVESLLQSFLRFTQAQIIWFRKQYHFMIHDENLQNTIICKY